MLSRVANSLYWMSRYLERANNIARFIDVNLLLILDMRVNHEQTQWEPLIQTTGQHAEFLKHYAAFNEENVVKFLTFDTHNPNSIIACVHSARENARTIREMISSDLWKCINEFYHFVNKNSKKRKIHNLQAFYTEINAFNNLIVGIQQDSISHNEAWHFIRLGQMLERADKTARLLDVKYFLLSSHPDEINSLHDIIEWGAVLQSASAFEMYQKQFHRISYQNVTKFLILDPDFPRAIKYCMDAAAVSLQKIITIIDIDFDVDVPAHNEMKKIKNLLLTTNIEHILAHGLHEFIDLFQVNLNVLDRAIYQSFFATKKHVLSSNTVNTDSTLAYTDPR
ncbi:MAG: alpha-E domain-containing protein [Legionellaceae bacterium]|nr:alpha-E domain-containing protein [Legionellaceae bacterium]